MEFENREEQLRWIKTQALSLGYELAGFTSLKLRKEDSLNLANFARETEKGSMSWFQRHLSFRQNPKRLFTKAKSALVLGLYYRDLGSEQLLKKSKIQISRYAHGKDYHRVLRKKAKGLIKLIKKNIPELEARICVDSAPIPEKILGRMAGLGWQGKNTNLIHPKLGSYFFLSVLLLNIDLIVNENGWPSPSSESSELSDPIPDHCRDCSLCIEACPTQALSSAPPYGINAHRCLSYLNIEHKESLDTLEAELQNSFSKQAFGCDICQEVCPYNRNRQTRQLNTQEESFHLDTRIYELMKTGYLSPQTNWEEWSKGSPLKRISLEKMQENLKMAKK